MSVSLKVCEFDDGTALDDMKAEKLGSVLSECGLRRKTSLLGTKPYSAGFVVPGMIDPLLR